MMVCHQVHGNEVWRVRPDDVEGWIPQRYLGNRVEGQPKLPIADAMVTDLPELRWLFEWPTVCRLCWQTQRLEWLVPLTPGEWDS
ncbi:hypothetical protein JCM18916_1950 [Cutibacterium acnes JCM 18916]|nr:hypothetical protein JCM18916_1950 [Cutibacterium acnes JCM 18916]